MIATCLQVFVTVFSRPQLGAVLGKMEKEADERWGRQLGQGGHPGRCAAKRFAACCTTTEPCATILNLLSASLQSPEPLPPSHCHRFHIRLCNKLQDRVGGAGPPGRRGARLHGRAAGVL
jgi:hypothetical protein